MKANLFYPGQNNGINPPSDSGAYIGINGVQLTDTFPYALGTPQIRINGGSWQDLTLSGSFWVADDSDQRINLAGPGVYTLEIRDSNSPTNIISLLDFEIEDIYDGCDTGWVEHQFTIDSSAETIKYRLNGYNEGPYSNTYYDIGGGFVEIIPSINTQVTIADYTNVFEDVIIRTTKSAVNCDYPSARIYSASFFEPLMVEYSKTNTSSESICNGTIELSPSGGSGDYYYIWGDGPQSQNRTGLCADVYTVTVYDYVTGESVELNITITTSTGVIGITNLITPVNRWNFMRWYSLGNIQVESLNTIDFDVSDFYPMPMAQDDTISFYVNFDNLIDDGDFENWRLGVFNCDFSEITTFDVLEKDVVTEGRYNVHGSFVVPELLKNDFYYFVMYNYVSRDTKYISNPYQFRTVTTGTYLVEYSHSSDIYNFFYDNVPTFTNKFRIPLEILRPQTRKETQGYKLINGLFHSTRVSSVGTEEFITGHMDKYLHKAFEAMIDHDNIIIDDRNWLRNENDEYQVDYTNDYPFAQGVVRLDDIAYAISNKMC